MIKKIFVTGGSGFIGSAIVKYLVDCNYDVTVLDNNSRGSKLKLDGYLGKINFIEGDVRDPKNFENLNNFDTIIHLAYVNGTKYFYEIPYEILDIGIKGIMNVLDAIKKFNIQNLIVASTSEVYQSPKIIPTPEEIEMIVPNVLNPRYSYGGGKIATELLAVNFCKQNNLNLKIFRPHNIYGPDMGHEHVIPEIIYKILRAKSENEKKIQMQGDGLDTRSFMYISDFILAFDKILGDINSDNIIYNIGNSDEIAIIDIYKKLAFFSDYDVQLIAGEKPQGATARRCPNNKKITNLGYIKKINIDDGLKQTYTWYEKIYYSNIN